MLRTLHPSCARAILRNYRTSNEKAASGEEICLLMVPLLAPEIHPKDISLGFCASGPEDQTNRNYSALLLRAQNWLARSLQLEL